MHPNGQLPAYEWAFGDVNPPVHAWAAWRVYKIEKKRRGEGDRKFLERIFQKLLLNFTWWVNRKDAEGKKHFPGRLSRPRQHRRIRPQRAAADRRPHRAIRRHQLDGHVLPEHAGDRARAGARKLRLRGRRQQILRTFCLYRRSHEQPRRRRHRACGIKKTASITTCCTCRTATHLPLKVRSMVGLIPLFAVETLGSGAARPLAGFQTAHAVVHRKSRPS